MTTLGNAGGDQEPAPFGGVLAGNLGAPILLSEVNLCGVLAAPAQPGETASVWTRMMLTSSDPLFHEIVPHLAGAVEAIARSQGKGVSLAHHSTVLLVVRPDDEAELWLDTAAVVADSVLRSASVKAGTVLFERDIADVTGMWFPLVEIGPQDRILCLFREGWRFALFFDFNPDSDLDVRGARRALGTLLRRLRYARLFSVLAHERKFPVLVQAGWFPFLELLGQEFSELVAQLENGFDLPPKEEALVAKFDTERLDRMFDRWMVREHFKERETILRSGVNAFRAQDPVGAIKTILTEIEGVLSDACFRLTGERTHRMPKLLNFIEQAAVTRAGGPDTLFFPAEFARYLRDYTFAGFEPGAAKTASRNAVGHGALPADQYTMVRALQAILTLDQLAFYT